MSKTPRYVETEHFQKVMQTFVQSLFNLRADVAALERCLKNAGVISDAQLLAAVDQVKKEAENALLDAQKLVGQKPN